MRDLKSIIEGIVSQAKVVGSGGSAFRSQSVSNASRSDQPGSHSHGLDIGARRNASHERESQKRAEDNARKREQETQRRAKEAEQRKKETMSMAKEEEVKEARKPGRSLMDDPRVKRALMVHNTLQGKSAPKPEDSEKKKEEVKEDKMSAGTEARTKIKNVARMDDADPKSEKSTLGKTGQIKTKVIDEGKPTMSLPNFGLPASLIAAARQIVEKKQDDDDGKDPKKMSGGKTAVELEPETNDKIDEGEPKTKKHTIPKTDKEKKLAALASPKDKITHKDVLVGRGVVKEDDDYDDEHTLKDMDSTGDHLEAAHKKGVNHLKAALKGSKTRTLQALRHYNMGHSSLRTDHPIIPHINRELKSRGVKEEVDIDEGDLSVRTLYNKMGGDKSNKPVYKAIQKVHGAATLNHLKRAYSANVRGDFDKEDSHFDKARASSGKKDSIGATVGRNRSAFRKANEEVEQVDEISKATLASYVKKSTVDAANQGSIAGRGTSIYDKEGMAAMDKSIRKIGNRERGVSKAVDRLTKEEVEQVDESMFGRKGTPAGGWRKPTTPEPKSGGSYGKLELRKIPSKKVKTQEEVEQIDERADEHGYSLHKTAHKRERGVTGGFGEPVAATKITYTVKQHGKKVGEIHKHRDTYEPTASYTGHLHGKKIPYSRTKGHGVHALMKDIVGSKWHAKHAPKVAKEEVEQVDEVSKATLSSYVKKVAATPAGQVKPSREKGIEAASKKLRKEDVAFSAEEEARIAEIAKSFPAEIDEAVKKSNTTPSATTATSSPVRGANQDQSGFGTKSSTADYTISDEKKVRKEEVELDEGRGRPRKNPAPGGSTEAEGDDTHKHPMQQLEKISHAIEGSEPHFEHKDGSKSKVSRHLARHIVSIHNSMRTTQEKDNFAQKVHANRDSMKAEVSKHI